MSAIKLTFDGSLNTAKQDAYFNYYLTNKQNGIIKGLGGEVTASASNGIITFTDGFVSVYGRRVYLEKGTSIKVSLDSTKYGYVILSINTSVNTVVVTTKEGTATAYPSLTKTDLLANDGIYELVICGYYKTSSSLTLNTSGVEYVKTLEERLTALADDTKKKIDAIQNGIQYNYFIPNSHSGDRYTFDISGLSSRSNGLVHFYICNNFISFSIAQLSLQSGGTITYDYLGSTYKLSISYTNSGNLTITVGDTTHTIKGIYVHY